MKKKLIIIVSIICLLIITLSIININNKDTNKSKKIDIKVEKYSIDELVKIINTDYINIEFLNWIKDNYGEDTIIKLSDYLKSNEYNNNIWHNITNNSFIVLKDLYENNIEKNNNIKLIKTNNDIASISFVGDISLADNWYIMPKYNERDKGVYGILSEDTVKVMTESDIMIANNEFTISNRGTKMDGKTYTFRANPKNLKVYSEMGIDLVTLANNHVFDFGEDAFLDMLEALDEYNMPHIGAGKNIDEARLPYYFILNGYKIAFVNATRAEKNILTPGATKNSPGVFRCYETDKLIETIKEAKQNSDYVIALLHWGREDLHELEQVIMDTGKQYIDAGADVIVGSHAHTLQGIEFYKNKPIIYNLGDFIFGKDSIDTGIFKINLDNNGNMEYYFLPCYESEEYTKLLYGKEKQSVIDEMIDLSINANIDANGKITERN